MLYTYFGYKWPNVWDILKSCQIISLCRYYISLEKAVSFDLNNIYTPWHNDALWKAWLKYLGCKGLLGSDRNIEYEYSTIWAY